ncbi:MAG: inorganic phosphate transporter, partial [Planctomycetaceae bacterium]|nr:inorganic phosphate transporter [Planctomycetaceae bacterium]
LLMLVPNFSPMIASLFVGFLIAVGAMVDARRVAETLGKKITGMTPGQGFAANLVTSLLVTTASLHSMPVSTTHVSVGSMLGIGAVTSQARWRSVGYVFLAWITTVPCAGLFAASAYFVFRFVRQ